MGAPSKETKAQFNALVREAKQHEDNEEYGEALVLYQKAAALVPNEQISKKITKLTKRVNAARTVLPDGFVRDDGADVVILDDLFTLPTEMYNRLYPHQREGIQWLWSLHQSDSGGILGDDMGLGKTIQISSFIGGLFDSKLAQRVLIVMPVSLMPNWVKELKMWAPDVRVMEYYGTNKDNRARCIEKIKHRNGGVLLTTYGMISSNTDDFRADAEFSQWDYVILDEGMEHGDIRV